MSKKQSHKSGACGMANDDDRKMRKLFVDKLSSAITEDDIYSVFSKHGEIEEVAKYQDRRAPTRYFAFVVYKKAKDCTKATMNPCPVIRGRKCTCMLAAIGKEFSGYKFFVQEGLLTEEQKQQNAANQSNAHSNHQNNANSNSKHNKKQRQRRHKNNKNKNHNNNKHHQPQRPRINIPSFKDEQLSQRSGVVSNSSFSDTSPVQYLDQPSWHNHYQHDSHKSHSTIISNAVSNAAPPSFHRESKSLQFQARAYNNNGGYNTPQTHTHHPHTIAMQPQQQQQQQQQHHMCNNEDRYRSYSMNNTPYIHHYPSYPQLPHSNPVQQQYNNNYYQQQAMMQQQQAAYYNNQYTQQARRRTQSSSGYNNNSPQGYNNNNAISFAQLQLPPNVRNCNSNNGYSLSPQPQHATASSFVVPPMRQSISYNSLERSQSHSPQSMNRSKMKVMTPTRAMLRRNNIQQQSAPKLFADPAKTQFLAASKVKRTSSNPGLFTQNSAPMRYYEGDRSRSGMVLMEPTEVLLGSDPADIMLSSDLLMDLNDSFAEIGIEIGLTPTPPPPLPLQNDAKASIDIDTLKVPITAFKSIEDAKKASDKVLEAGFTMLASPTATASVHTEYESGADDLDGFILNDYD